MLRPLRIESAGAVYHITSRGNARQSIFLDDSDRKKFLEILASTIKRYHWICPAYCIMDNHYHLIIETPEGNISRGMRQLNGVYTQYFKRKHKQLVTYSREDSRQSWWRKKDTSYHYAAM